MTAQRQPLSNGRWHFQHGPIDVVISAQGDTAVVAQAHEAAWQRFRTVLEELVAELPVLRRPLPDTGPLPEAHERLQGTVARCMWDACAPFREGYITPMAAVAGSVAQALIAFYQQPGVDRAWVNNGGDIAFHVAPGHALRVGLFADLSDWPAALAHSRHPSRHPSRQSPGGLATDAQWSLDSGLPARGIATSGWRGRSLSLGIADSVTVLAPTASQADAAATVIANAVNVADAASAGIVRQPACYIVDDTDLGALPVTVDVPALDPAVVHEALQAGLVVARSLQQRGLIWFAALFCQGQWCSTPDLGVGTPAQLGSVFSPALSPVMSPVLA